MDDEHIQRFHSTGNLVGIMSAFQTDKWTAINMFGSQSFPNCCATDLVAVPDADKRAGWTSSALNEERKTIFVSSVFLS